MATYYCLRKLHSGDVDGSDDCICMRSLILHTWFGLPPLFPLRDIIGIQRLLLLYHCRHFPLSTASLGSFANHD